MWAMEVGRKVSGKTVSPKGTSSSVVVCCLILVFCVPGIFSFAGWIKEVVVCSYIRNVIQDEKR